MFPVSLDTAERLVMNDRTHSCCLILRNSNTMTATTRKRITRNTNAFTSVSHNFVTATNTTQTTAIARAIESKNFIALFLQKMMALRKVAHGPSPGSISDFPDGEAQEHGDLNRLQRIDDGSLKLPPFHAQIR